MKDLNVKEFSNLVAQSSIVVARAAVCTFIKTPGVLINELADLSEAGLRKLSESSNIKLGGLKKPSKTFRSHHQDVHDDSNAINHVLDGRTSIEELIATCIVESQEAKETSSWTRFKQSLDLN